MSISIGVCDNADKLVQLTSLQLFTFNDAKHQRKIDANANADTVNGA